MNDMNLPVLGPVRCPVELASPAPSQVASLYCEGLCLDTAPTPVADQIIDWAQRAHDLLGALGSEDNGLENWCRYLRPFFHRSCFLERAWSKPRGYAGDYLTIQMMYDARPAGSGAFGRAVDAWALHQPAARAVRNRRRLVGDLIAQLESDFPGQPLSVTSLGCGPAAEVFDLANRDAVTFNLIDIDEEALAFIQRKTGTSNGARLNLIRANIVKMALGRTQGVAGRQHGFYSLGVIDYLNDDLVVRLLDALHAQLHVGGQVMLGNFRPGHPNASFFLHALDWPLCLRSEDQLMSLVARSRFSIANARLGAESEGVQLFVTAKKV